MYRQIAVLLVGLITTSSLAHEMTPTYPVVWPSHMEGVHTTKVEVFNRREDVEYYEIGVFDKDFNSVPFTSLYKIVKVNYLSRVNIDIYFREEDVNKVNYVCSKSKLRKTDLVRTAVSSRICSKVK
jgi:hypothetical protein